MPGTNTLVFWGTFVNYGCKIFYDLGPKVSVILRNFFAPDPLARYARAFGLVSNFQPNLTFVSTATEEIEAARKNWGI